MSDLDYENTIAYLDGRIEELEAERKIDKDVLLKQDQTIQLRNAELQTAHEIGARHAKRVGEQAIELQALREAAEALVKSGFRVEREDFSTNVDSAKFDALQAALEGGGDE
jgi:adenylosuccinate lyase